MLKYAFIENVPNAAPETYACRYQNEEASVIVAGTSSFEMTASYVKELCAEGVDAFDLCGDFTDEQVKTLTESTGSSSKIRHADYLPAEMAKLEAADSLMEYGIIVVLPGVKETAAYAMRSPECNTMVRIAGNLEMACAAARDLRDEGIQFIELCSWFDREKTEAIIASVDGEIPVGTCGAL